MVDGEELYEGMEGLGSDFRLFQTGAGQQIGQRSKG